MRCTSEIRCCSIKPILSRPSRIEGRTSRVDIIFVYKKVSFPASKPHQSLIFEISETLSNRQIMHFLTQLSLAALTAFPFVTSVAIDIEKRAPSISVELSKVSNTVVKAAVKNTASEDLTLLKKGTFLDSAPVEKVTVSKDGP